MTPPDESGPQVGFVLVSYALLMLGIGLLFYL